MFTSVMPRNYAGTRDWFGEESSRRRFIIDRVIRVFREFGYEELETPIIELADTLRGKYGEEGNSTMYLFGKSGDNIGLRYDQTVPLARVAAQFSNDLVFPYRRFAIGPVFRADKPQAGRYRQFTQMDFDILGVDSVLADAEVVAILYKVAYSLGFRDFRVLVSDRDLLTGMAKSIGARNKDQILTAIRGWDKLVKVGVEQVLEEVSSVGLSTEAFRDTTENLLSMNGDCRDVVESLRNMFTDNATVKKGINRLSNLIELVDTMEVPQINWRIAPTLARGLEYYTGPIFEVEAGQGIGSIAGGGRYDSLIQTLGGPSITGTGASFGLERVYTVMEQLGLFPDQVGQLDVFVTVFMPELLDASVRVATQLRSAGFKVEVNMTEDRLGAQLKLADRRKARFALVIGPDEVRNGTISIKRLRLSKGGTTKNQVSVPESQLVDTLQQFEGE